MTNSRNLIAGILVFTLFVVYSSTLAPGLTWANSGVDGGDLITAAAIGGVPHPTGYPLYLLLARGFQLLPLGSLALRTNFMSAVFTILTAVTVYEIVIQSLATQNSLRAQLAGLLAGLAIGLSPVVWSQAVITEVYTLNAFFVALILYLAIRPVPAESAGRRKLDGLRGLTLGLALCNHVTILLLAFVAWMVNAVETIPAVAGAPRIPGKSVMPYRWRWGAVLRQAVWALVGLAMYATLYFKALAHPAVNWGNPVTLQQFWWLVSGQAYQHSYLAGATPAYYADRVSSWASLLIDQFGPVGLVLGCVGLVIYFQPSRLYLLTAWSMAAFSIFTMMYQPRDAFVYLIPALVSFSIWIGTGVGNLAEALAFRRRWMEWGLWGIMFVYFAGLAIYHWPRVDASRDLRAENFGRRVLAVAPSNAIVFAKGDAATFSLWYFHYALQERPDIVVIASDFLHIDWYQEIIRTVYPALVIPGAFPEPATLAAANPDRPVCYVHYLQEEEIVCDPSASAPLVSDLLRNARTTGEKLFGAHPRFLVGAKYITASAFLPAFAEVRFKR